MGSQKNQDWARELIAEMKDIGIEDNAEATRRFVAAYQGGDTPEAWKSYTEGAAVNASADGLNKLVVFADGSVYCDSGEGIDRFFPSLDKLRQENPEEPARFGL